MAFLGAHHFPSPARVVREQGTLRLSRPERLGEYGQGLECDSNDDGVNIFKHVTAGGFHGVLMLARLL